MRIQIAVFLVLVVTGCSGQRPVVGPEGSGTSITFDDVDPGTGEGVDAAPLLSRYGISVANVTEGTRVVVRSEQSLYAGQAARAPSPPNVLTQVGKNEPVSFELVFASPASRVQFRRAGLIGTGPSGITHPGWAARAIDAQGRELDAVGEDYLGSYADVPTALFKLAGPGIATVRFESDGLGSAAFSAVLLDDLRVE
jgi:hypothetical protein